MKKIYRFDDNAVSEVIGVILIIVIVTVLASVTAIFVFSYLQGLNTPHIVEFSFHRMDSSTIQVLNSGGAGVKDLDPSAPDQYPFIVSIDGHVTAPISPTKLTKDVGSFGDYNANVGQTITIIGLFTGDKQQVLYQGIV